MVCNATFNNISVILWWSVLLVEETEENHCSVASHEQTLSHKRLKVMVSIHYHFYTPTHRVGAILQSPCPSVRSHFRNRYLSFYWKKWFYIWFMALAWWLVPCLPFPGSPHIYFLFTVRLTNERMGVFLARRSMQHLVLFELRKKE